VRAINVTLWILAAAVIAGTIVPAHTAAASKETDLILAELRQLQAQVSQIQRAQGELERILNQLASRADEDAAMRQTIVDTQTTLDDLKESLSIISSRLDETNDRVGNVRRELVALRQVQQPTFIAAEGEPDAENHEELSGGDGTEAEEAQTPAVAAAAPNPVDLYNQAYTDYTQMRYPLAVSGFKDVIQRFPESDLADNAQYWIGECYLAQRQYKEALEAFENVLYDYPDSNKLAEAGYKRAHALEGLGRREDAIKQLEFVIEQYPRTQVERSATLFLKKLKSYEP
jgi:tol-pal system protein YbgF